MKSDKMKERELIIRLADKKKSVRYIADSLGVSKSKASFWIRRYRKTNSLADLPRSGKKSQLNKEQFLEIKDVLNDFPPSRYGGKSMGWTTKMLLKHINDKYGSVFGMRYAQKIMHKCGISLITPRSEHAKASYAARTVYRMDFKKNSKKNIWVAPSLISTKRASD